MNLLGSVAPNSTKLSKENEDEEEGKVGSRRTFKYKYSFVDRKMRPLSATINNIGTREPTNGMPTEGSSFDTLCWSTQAMMNLFPEVTFQLLNARYPDFYWDCSAKPGGHREHEKLKEANENWNKAKIELTTSVDCPTAFGEQNASSIFKVLAKLHQLFFLETASRSFN